MATKFHGRPCWFELGTTDLDGAKAFYGKVLGWTVGDSAMPDFDYRLATVKGERDMVAGLMTLDQQPPGTPPNWVIYFATDDCDATARRVEEKGGTVIKQPDDIPGTGRFAVVTDPQGAVFGILQPDMSQMSPEDIAQAEAGHGAFDPETPGHGAWVELMSSDPEAGFDFYADLFGWTRGEVFPAEDEKSGDYQLFQNDGVAIGGMMGLGDAPMPVWLPYFGIESATATVEAVKAAGGHVEFGPMEVPGPAWTVLGSDPQGAWVAFVGQK